MNQLNLNYYGKYAVPETVRGLFEFEQELRAEDLSLDFNLGLIMTQEDIRYMSTPPDVIPFASCGVDGIHYGFLTFGASVHRMCVSYEYGSGGLDCSS